MRVFFIGTVEFSRVTLETLCEMGINIIGVATKQSSPYNSDFANLTEICTKNEIPYNFVNNINDQTTIEWINELKPDIICCFGWSQIIRDELLNIPKFGIIGYHPAKLPKNRGRHPLIWALILGLNSTASTFFFMDEGADSGDIISQKDILIDYHDDAATLYKKMIDTAKCQLIEFFPNLIHNNVVRIQQDHSASNFWRKRNDNDCRIDFRMTSRNIYNLIRGLTKPYIGAHLIYKGKRVRIWKSEEVIFNEINIEPGKVLEVCDGKITIKCMENAICLIEHEFEQFPKIGDYVLNE